MSHGPHLIHVALKRVIRFVHCARRRIIIGVEGTIFKFYLQLREDHMVVLTKLLLGDEVV